MAVVPYQKAGRLSGTESIIIAKRISTNTKKPDPKPHTTDLNLIVSPLNHMGKREERMIVVGLLGRMDGVCSRVYNRADF